MVGCRCCYMCCTRARFPSLQLDFDSIVPCLTLCSETLTFSTGALRELLAVPRMELTTILSSKRATSNYARE
jgi:hypothetical protein